MLRPDESFFDEGPKRAAAFIDGWKAYGAPGGMQIWAGEIAAAWHSGAPGVTDRFISSFWYADELRPHVGEVPRASGRAALVCAGLLRRKSTLYVCSVLFCSILFYFVLFCSILFYSVLFYSRYADALGRLAALNHSGFCRQSLAGGYYGLIDRT